LTESQSGVRLMARQPVRHPGDHWDPASPPQDFGPDPIWGDRGEGKLPGIASV